MQATRIQPIILTLFLLGGSLRAAEPIGYEVVASHPHDEQAWTQGLFYEDGQLFESTGLYGESTLRRVDLESGRVLKKHALSDAYFGEGLTLFQGRLYQLTWQAGKGFIYDPETFEKTGEFNYTGEGWGLTHDEAHLILSDGTATIRFLDPETFEVVRRINVTLGSRSVRHLNELEYIDGFIYANVWYQDVIVKIDPETGAIAGLLNLKDLWPERPTEDGAVLNGIAYDPGQKRLFITGKFWSRLFVIRLTGTGDDQP
ncbi:MAG: glutaminyl-peptide cyclotransferase [Opitutales bacterium]